jgi:hypothetical protein
MLESITKKGAKITRLQFVSDGRGYHTPKRLAAKDAEVVAVVKRAHAGRIGNGEAAGEMKLRGNETCRRVGRVGRTEPLPSLRDLAGLFDGFTQP